MLKKSAWVILAFVLFGTMSSFVKASKSAMAAGSIAGKMPVADRTVKVDESGVLRWRDTGDEVVLFGINYTVPFAFTYRAHNYVGASHQQSIDDDVRHFARMGLDAYRVHVWDQEISDRRGNLVDNEHLDLLDYLIYKLKLRGIYTILTPIGATKTGYPEPDPPAKGFSYHYNKKRLATEPEAIEKQQRYLTQFLNHVNRYTNLAYKDDPAILAFEPCNEPAWLPADGVTKYINVLTKAIRDTGCDKPVFYFVTKTDSDSVEAFSRSTVDGASFGWYPTGLVNDKALRGNPLGSVDSFFEKPMPLLDKRAKIVYEFDAADVAGSYMYPAMARTFRAEGMQWATMFAYDPMAIAFNNGEYQTHYLNLVYSPSKAVSFIIAAEAFHRLPRLKSYGSYPGNTRFGPFRVSYQQDISEMVTEKQFMYSNNTETRPPKPEMLERVVGCGSSPVVDYEGLGCYFLEKVKTGLWRLEVYPDAVWINDPFGKPDVDWEVSRIIRRKWPMKISLPDLGRQFVIEPVNEANTYKTKTTNGTFAIRPGVYLLGRKGVEFGGYTPSMPFGRVLLGEFVVPAEKTRPMVVLHEAPYEVVEGRDWQVKAEVVSSGQPGKVTLYMRRAAHRSFTSYPMQKQRGYGYAVKIPGKEMKAGLLEYYITVQEGRRFRVFPDNRLVRAEPTDWYGHVSKFWDTFVVSKDAPVEIFNATRDRDNLYLTNFWRGVEYKLDFIPGSSIGQLALRLDVPDFRPHPQDVSGRFAFGNEIDTRRQDLKGFKRLKIYARAGKEATSHFEIALIEKDGSAWGAVVPLTTKWRHIGIPLGRLKHTAITDLPQPAPKNIVHLEKGPAGRGGRGDRLRIKDIEAVNFSFGGRLFPYRLDKPHAIELESITLEK